MGHGRDCRVWGSQAPTSLPRSEGHRGCDHSEGGKPGLAGLRWERPRNISDWRTLRYQGGELKLRKVSDKTEVSREAATALGVGDIHLRASLVLVGVDECYIMGHVAGGGIFIFKKLWKSN